MFDKLTYKQRNYGLLLLFVLMLMVSYKRSFVLTVQIKQEIARQELQKHSIKNSNKKVELLRVEIERINKSLGKTGIASGKVQQELLKRISNFPKKYNLKIASIQPTHLFNTLDFKILTNEVLIECSYNGIVHAINSLENTFDYARIINAELYKTKTVGNKKSKLYAKLLFQHYFKI